jgi:hypothetical protein
MFTFREAKQNWFGFSEIGNGGTGLGDVFAVALNRNLATVFRAFGETVTRASHLEKLCLIRDGVGKDNISDFHDDADQRLLADIYGDVCA